MANSQHHKGLVITVQTPTTIVETITVTDDVPAEVATSVHSLATGHTWAVAPKRVGEYLAAQSASLGDGRYVDLEEATPALVDVVCQYR